MVEGKEIVKIYENDDIGDVFLIERKEREMDIWIWESR